MTDWWEGLKFFFHRSFMRGRRDKLSNKYLYFTCEVLSDRFGIKDNSENAYQKMSDLRSYFDITPLLELKRKTKRGKIQSLAEFQDFASKNEIVRLLITPKEIEVSWEGKAYREKVKLDNHIDIIMVLDVLDFVTARPRHKNIYKYVYDTLVKNKASESSKRLNNIYTIGDKISCLIIRDILLLNPEIKISPENYIFAFPVDTWVVTIAERLGYNEPKFSDLKKRIIDDCLKAEINPCKVAAGLWLVGAHAVDLLIEICLGNLRF
ncbi:MAG TPA: hypothetical protein PKZ60_08985 [Candidatus Saccharicenans sp.]|nr:hypothetical protein [Candidatus Saccharicenans sp.]